MANIIEAIIEAFEDDPEDTIADVFCALRCALNMAQKMCYGDNLERRLTGLENEICELVEL